MLVLEKKREKLLSQDADESKAKLKELLAERADM